MHLPSLHMLRTLSHLGNASILQDTTHATLPREVLLSLHVIGLQSAALDIIQRQLDARHRF